MVHRIGEQGRLIRRRLTTVSPTLTRHVTTYRCLRTARTTAPSPRSCPCTPHRPPRRSTGGTPVLIDGVRKKGYGGARVGVGTGAQSVPAPLSAVPPAAPLEHTYVEEQIRKREDTPPRSNHRHPPFRVRTVRFLAWCATAGRITAAPVDGRWTTRGSENIPLSKVSTDIFYIL